MRALRYPSRQGPEHTSNVSKCKCQFNTCWSNGEQSIVTKSHQRCWYVWIPWKEGNEEDVVGITGGQKVYRPATGKRGCKRRVGEVVKVVRKFCDEDFGSFLNLLYILIKILPK